MSVWYLDLDDEITDAVARLRAAKDDRVVLVLPPGSRIGTGRINFRLLAREADTRGLMLALVSGDPQVRALAASAGLTPHASVADAERTLGLEVDEDAPGGSPAGAAAGAIPPAARVSTAVNAADAGFDAEPGGHGASGGGRFGSLLHRGRHRDGYAVTPRTASAAAAADGAVAVVPLDDVGRVARRGPSTKRRVATWGMRGAMVGALAAGGLYVAYLTLPTATVTLTPGTTSLGPVDVTIVASPNTVTVDPMAGAIHAEWRPYPLSATDTFKATGRENVLTAARGEIRITTKNTVTDTVVPEGAVVRTADGKEYRVLRRVKLPKWSAENNAPKPSETVAVEAVKLGESGNTGRDTVRVVSGPLERQGVTVTNPAPITGGSSSQTPFVKKADCEAAQAALVAGLQANLAADVATGPDPGMALFTESADLGPVDFQPTCTDLIGQQVERFELTALATGNALQVDETDLLRTAEEHFRLTTEVVGVEPGSIAAGAAGEPVVDRAAGTVTYPLAVTARVTKPYDAAAVKGAIAGQPVEEARRLLLEWGEAKLELWPDFVPNVPTDANRITLINTQQ